MIINFLTCGISRGTRKLARIPTLIIIKKKLDIKRAHLTKSINIFKCSAPSRNKMQSCEENALSQLFLWHV